MKNRLFLIVLLLLQFGPFLMAQPSDSCRVLLPEISGEYYGPCKDGYADGKGLAKGVDTYAGLFKGGLPHGRAEYTYKNGNCYKGAFSHGLKHGIGRFTYYIDGKEQILKGYWSNGEYAGISKPDEFYRVTNISGIEHYSINKAEGFENQVTISFESAMIRNIPDELEITISSGELVKENKNYSAYHYTLPVNCSMQFIIRTPQGFRMCNFSFDILEPGKYVVLISNS